MSKTITTTKPHFLIVGLVTIGLLLIPLVAMQFTTQVVWGPLDFLIMGILIFATGISIDFAVQRAGKYRVPAIAMLIFVFLLIWAELATDAVSRFLT